MRGVGRSTATLQCALFIILLLQLSGKIPLIWGCKKRLLFPAAPRMAVFSQRTSVEGALDYPDPERSYC
jgi:hypothetical protein